MNIPAHAPTPGFYYHYKHDPRGPLSEYAYELLSIGFDTELSDTFYVNYRPLYRGAITYTASRTLGVPCVYSRPLTMWSEEVLVHGVRVPRFTKIVDQSVTQELDAIRADLYPTPQGQ